GRDRRGDRPDTPALRAARLADHRRHAPLHRGDGRGHHPAVSRPRSAGARSMTAVLQEGRPPLILASTSKTRARMLESAGLSFICEPPGLDEATMRQAIAGEQTLDPHDVAEILARAKAEAVSDLAQGAYVIGADQVLA